MVKNFIQRRTRPPHPQPSIHTVDQDDIIIDVNAAWLKFAQDNEAPHLTYDKVVGHSLWTFIAGPEATQIYQLLMRQVRQSQQRVVFTYRCDSPTVRRYMQMEIVPSANEGLQFKNYLLFENRRAPVSILDVTTQRTDEFLRMCSWCSRIQYEEWWLPVAEAVLFLGLFGSRYLPQITHSICPDCYRSLRASLEPV